MSENPRYLYVHIPKTGGVSFRQILIDAFPAQRIKHVAPGPRIVEETNESLAGYDVVHGHFDLSDIAHLQGFRKVVTLRDPVSRCISAYNFWRSLDASDPRWDETGRLMISTSQACTIDQMLEHEDQRVCNAFVNKQVAMLSGVNAESVQLGSKHLSMAVKALAEFDFVGLNEELALSKALFCHKFGFYCASVDQRLNVSKRRSEVPQETLRKLELANALDLQLLSFVRKRGLFAINGITVLPEMFAS